jgi:hypothetical protein
MYENVCGNCVGGIEFDICLTLHKRAFDFFNTIAH